MAYHKSLFSLTHACFGYTRRSAANLKLVRPLLVTALVAAPVSLPRHAPLGVRTVKRLLILKSPYLASGTQDIKFFVGSC
eukprot:5574688-Pleurochrysis_carterae.AAC.2